MTDQHPITPPRELVEQWEEQWCDMPVIRPSINSYMATQAAQWGADLELEACCEWLAYHAAWSFALRAARRPKPPSLKEQALALVTHDFSDQPCLSEEGYALIRRALLAHPTPQLVVVSERLPEPGEWVWHCYAGVRLWQHGIYNGRQFFIGNGPESHPATHWLPANALPTPELEALDD